MKHVTIAVPSGQVTLSTVIGTVEILGTANAYWQRLGHRPLLDIQVAGTMTELRPDPGFFSIHPSGLQKIKKTDLVILASAAYDGFLINRNKELLDWIVRQYKGGAEIATMCSGAFLLAATGLLDGKTCSTHWEHTDTFRNLYPTVDLQADKTITYESGIYTNGGAYSFLNLMLFIVENYFDRATAIYCSKTLQIDMDRTSQSPFFIFRAQKAHGDDMVCRAQHYIEEHLTKKISFEKLAFQFAVSRRNFDRRFTRATGNTPLEYLQRAKIEVAKKSFEKGRKNVLEVMQEVGYSDEKAFREVFRKVTGLSPLDYRARYATGPR